MKTRKKHDWLAELTTLLIVFTGIFDISYLCYLIWKAIL